MKKKLSLEDLKVESFVTKEELKGGAVILESVYAPCFKTISPSCFSCVVC